MGEIRLLKTLKLSLVIKILMVKVIKWFMMRTNGNKLEVSDPTKRELQLCMHTYDKPRYKSKSVSFFVNYLLIRMFNYLKFYRWYQDCSVVFITLRSRSEDSWMFWHFEKVKKNQTHLQVIG